MNAQSMKRDFYAPSPAPAPLTYARDGANRTAMEALAHKHLPLVRRIAWHIHGTMSSIVEVEDLIQIGLVALLRRGGVPQRRVEIGAVADADQRTAAHSALEGPLATLGDEIGGRDGAGGVHPATLAPTRRRPAAASALGG